MPYTRRTYRKKPTSYKRKSFRRGNRKYSKPYRSIVGAITTVPGRNPVPNRLKTQFTYSGYNNCTGTLGAAYNFVVRGNGPYDPNQTATGAQPNGWDNMGAFYNKCTVLGSKIECWVSNTDAVPINFCLAPQSTASVGTNYTFDTYFQMPNARFGCVGIASGGNNIKYYKSYMTSKTMLNLNAVTEEDCSSSFASTPAIQWYWHMVGQALDRTSTCQFYLQYRITYFVILSERILLGQS